MLKNSIKKNLPLFVVLLILFVTYRAWLTTNLITAGDFWPLYFDQYDNYRIFPFAWNTALSTGLGGNSVFLLWNHIFLTLPMYFFGTLLHLPYEFAERLGYLFPLLILGFVSTYFWSRHFFKKNNILQTISGLAFSLNTYSLMIIGGGQLGIVFAYFFTPIVVLSFIKLISSPYVGRFKFFLRQAIITGVLFVIQLNLDLRMAYVTMIAVIIYFLFNIKYEISKRNILTIPRLIFYFFITPLLITILLNSFWIFPLVLSPANISQQLGSAYTSTVAVNFFSFAKLENTVALLHPLWPENIFGKVGFMKPEFLLLPILAFSSLFFISRTNPSASLRARDQRTKSYVLFFALLGLIGTFLAKGANDPFGGIYLWMFGHIPGFVMFRDPTKFYLLTALSYSVLIPYGVYFISDWIKSKAKNGYKEYLRKLFFTLIIFYLLFLISPALIGQLNGIFKSTTLPNDYKKLEKKLLTEQKFFRTLWIPQKQRFAFYSDINPAMNAQDLFHSTDVNKIPNSLEDDLSKKEDSMLVRYGVKYIILPYDSEKELFLNDRKYDGELYKKAVNDIEKIKWLKESSGFGKIKVFEVSNSKDHFWSPSTSLRINYKFINPTKYAVEIKNAKKGNILVFSESFDEGWIAYLGVMDKVSSIRYNKIFNSFRLEKDGNYSLEVYYEPQKWVERGMIVSLATFIFICASLLVLKLRFMNKDTRIKEEK